MKQDKETRSRLLQSARQEFIEKGYTSASLRNICKNAGVTTGALYFFFEDKADLFDAITKETIDSIYHLMQTHYQEEKELAAKGMFYQLPKDDMVSHYDISEMLIHQMYLHREEVLLILTKSQGTRWEHIEDKFIEITEEHYKLMAKQMQNAYPDKVLDERLIHWLAHTQIDAFIYMITHIEKEEDARKFISQATTYMMKGWYGLFMDKD